MLRTLFAALTVASMSSGSAVAALTSGEILQPDQTSYSGAELNLLISTPATEAKNIAVENRPPTNDEFSMKIQLDWKFCIEEKLIGINLPFSLNGTGIQTHLKSYDATRAAINAFFLASKDATIEAFTQGRIDTRDAVTTAVNQSRFDFTSAVRQTAVNALVNGNFLRMDTGGTLIANMKDGTISVTIGSPDCKPGAQKLATAEYNY